MPAIGQIADNTKQNLAFVRELEQLRPVPLASYPIGSLVKLASIDQQIYPDIKTVIPPTTATGQQLILGVVADHWPGFSPASNAFNGVAPAATARGSFDVDIVTEGYHPAILVDNSGTGAVAITNEIPLVPSRATSGRAQGIATAVAGLGTAAVASLPASGIGSLLGAGALAQASQTYTISGTPSTGDILTVNIQIPFVATAPGAVQTLSIATTLTSISSASVTAAATAVAAALNANATFAKYFVASSAAGVVTVAVNALSAPFLINYATTNGGISVTAGQLTVGLSGTVGNSIAFSVATTYGTSVSTAGGATLAGGTGYYGTVPGWVV